MNERTTKLLKKWASVTKKESRELTRWWLSLNKFQRTAERKKMKAELA